MSKYKAWVYRLWYRFKLTPEQWTAIATYQNNVCAFCGANYANGRRLAVDHDHETGLIRGLLCHRCNFVVAPIFEKNRDRIIGYYTSPPAVATIGEHHGYTGPVHDNMNMRMHHLGPEVLNAREEYERTKPTAVQILDTFMSPVE